MYLQYFGLRENPFSLPPDPHYLYLSRGHQEALAHLQFGLSESGGFVQLTGEVGTGKTLLLRALAERRPPDVDVALILYPVLNVAEFVAAVCDELGIPHPEERAGPKQLIDTLNAHLLQTHAHGRRTVLIIDEAQNLSREVLEQVRLLTNLETTKQKLLQIILIGQPELANLLAQQDLRQLAQRITARYQLTPLTHEETRDYIAHRCRVAGASRPLFDQGAIHRVHVLSGGIPRLINVICDRALLGAYARDKAVADARIVQRAAAQIGFAPRKRRGFLARILFPAAAILVVLAVSGWWWRSQWLTSSFTKSERTVNVSPGTPEDGAVAAATTTNLHAAAVPTSATTTTTTTPAPRPTVTLESLFNDPAVTADTESAMKALFERWNLDYSALAGATGCERALNAGLHCLYKTGTWNNLRRYDRPAIIELQDTAGNKYHVLVAALKPDTVTLEFGERRYELSAGDVDRYWYGKYLLLWKPPMPEQETLHLGTRGEAVIWLRDALARYRGEPLAPTESDLFDEKLQSRLIEFQRRQRLTPDGVVGAITRAQLQKYLPDGSPSLVADATEAR
ncbi:MAG: AAA family ATPase [Bacteroidota bacterium]